MEDNEEEIEKDINFIIEKIGKYTIHSKETEDYNIFIVKGGIKNELL